MSGIQTQTTSDVGGGLNVGWIDAGDWMDYAVNVVQTGRYNLIYRGAGIGSGSVECLVDGSSKGSISIGNTGGWQIWSNFSTTLDLASGNHTLRIKALAGGWNLNYLTFVQSSSSS